MQTLRGCDRRRVEFAPCGRVRRGAIAPVPSWFFGREGLLCLRGESREAREAAGKKEGVMGRLQGWALETRTRYASVWTAVSGAAILGIMAISGLSQRELAVGIAAAPIAYLVHGWIWYPRARRRLTAGAG